MLLNITDDHRPLSRPLTRPLTRQVEPIRILPPSELAKAYSHLGVNNKLGLSGRPCRPIGGLGTAKVLSL